MTGQPFDNKGWWALYQNRQALYQSIGPFQLADDGRLVSRQQAPGQWQWQDGLLTLSDSNGRVFFRGIPGDRERRFVETGAEGKGQILDCFRTEAPIVGFSPSFPLTSEALAAKLSAREDFTVMLETSREVRCVTLPIKRPPTIVHADVDALFGPTVYQAEPFYYQVIHDALVVSGVGVLDRSGRALYDTVYQAGLRTRHNSYPLLVADGETGLCLYGASSHVGHEIAGTALLFNTLRGNYGHWMVQSAPTAAMGRHAEGLGIAEGKPLTILDYSGQKEPFRSGAMAELGYADGQVVDMMSLPSTFKVERLIVPCTHRIPDMDRFPPGVLRMIDQSYPPLPPVGDEPEFIFINRNDLPRRGVANGAEVEAMLARYGFVSLNMTGMNFEQQRRIFSRAKMVISTHSGGMTNLLFAHQLVLVIELGHDWHRTVWYKHLCVMRGHGYVHLCFDTAPGDDPNPYQWQVMVDIPALEQVVLEIMPYAIGSTTA